MKEIDQSWIIILKRKRKERQRISKHASFYLDILKFFELMLAFHLCFPKNALPLLEFQIRFRRFDYLPLIINFQFHFVVQVTFRQIIDLMLYNNSDPSKQYLIPQEQQGDYQKKTIQFEIESQRKLNELKNILDERGKIYKL